MTPIANAIHQEILAGSLSPAGLSALIEYHQHPDADPDQLGGPPAAWLAATQGTQLQDRSARTDDWLTATRAAAPARIWAAARPGRTRPTVLRQLDKDWETIDQRYTSELRTNMENSLDQVLRKAGLTIQSQVKDRTLKAALQATPLNRVAAKANTLTVAGGKKTAMAAVTANVPSVKTDIQNLIERTVNDLTRRLTATLEKFQTETRQILKDNLGVEPQKQVIRISELVAGMVNRWHKLARRKLGIDPADPTGAMAEKASGNVGVGIITNTFNQIYSTQPAPAGTSIMFRLLLKDTASTLTNTDVSRETIRAAVGDASRETIRNTLQTGRGTLETDLIWEWAKYGRPETRFEPHYKLNGSRVGTQDYEDGITEPLIRFRKDAEGEDEEVVTSPWDVTGSWAPGDHDFCSCGFTAITAVVNA